MSVTINERIRAAVEPIVPVCVPDLYDGEAQEYCTFQYSQIPMAHGDNAPHAIRYLVQLHYFLPTGESPMRKRRELCRALLAADMTYPTVENASDETGQHYVIECEAVDGEV